MKTKTPEANLTFGQIVILANLPSELDASEFGRRAARLIYISTKAERSDEEMTDWRNLVEVIRGDLAQPEFVANLNYFLGKAGVSLIEQETIAGSDLQTKVTIKRRRN